MKIRENLDPLALMLAKRHIERGIELMVKLDSNELLEISYIEGDIPGQLILTLDLTVIEYDDDEEEEGDF